jgi:hypothetical protein
MGYLGSLTTAVAVAGSPQPVWTGLGRDVVRRWPR